MGFDSVKKGRIVAFRGTWGSGLATLEIEGENGVDSVHCENAATVRALEAAFGDVIGPGHTVKIDTLKGQPIAYTMGEMGLILGSFARISEYCMECGPFELGCRRCNKKEP